MVGNVPDVLGLDPGKMSGVAFWVPGQPINAVELNEDDTIDFVRVHIQVHVDANARLLIGAERFIPKADTSKHTRQTHASRIFDVLSQDARGLRVVTWSSQEPSVAKRLGTNETLKKLGWWNPTKDGHANDAARHVLCALLKHHPDVLYKLLETGTV